MKIKWLGHSCFLITSDSGTRIITDPYTSGNDFKYREIQESADIVTISHGHGDHGNSTAVRGNPIVLTQSADVKGIEFQAVASFHDDTQGSRRGNNTIFCFNTDGINVCHLGDLGHLLSKKQLTEIGAVDILCCPVGGFFTIDAEQATTVYNSLKPKVFIPMHFKNAGVPQFPIAGVDKFLKGKQNIVISDNSEVEFKANTLPQISQIIVLKPALL